MQMIILVCLASEAGASLPNILSCTVIQLGCEVSPTEGACWSLRAASDLETPCAAIPKTQGGSRAVLLFQVSTMQAT
ncbi:hypothetical protein [Mesorhizobium sp. INR15]|uniref:hypothetical protein n=1 Tax=Mesorhizobium sp. INR15 TaxID=2654248 RepID=UPI0018968FF9|nr:hypothetical protein [Mesorhizobium sp. INR15]QPC95606.1 hypothetical protein GA829_34070 [Mesorhizobium sp. INR15]